MQIKLADYQGYNEIVQSSNINFSFCIKEDEETLIELFYPVKCRDYLGDFVNAYHGGLTNYTVYFFKVFTESKLIDEDGAFYLKLTFTDGEKDTFKEESSNYPELSDVILDKDNFIVLRMDGIYLSNTVTISLLTWLIRVCGYPKQSPENHTNEAIYELRAKKYLDKLLNNLKEFVDGTKGFFTGWEGTAYANTVSVIHNQSGFTSIGMNPNKDNAFHKWMKKNKWI